MATLLSFAYFICIFIVCNSALPATRQRIHQKLSFNSFQTSKDANRDKAKGSLASAPEENGWIVNFPPEFHIFQKSNNFNRIHFGHESVSASRPLPGTLLDIRQDADRINKFEKFTRDVLPKVDIYTDGESIDAIEHFFWGMENGVSIELGALDGSPFTHSQTYEHEMQLGWKRILIEANPLHRHFLRKRSPAAFSALAPICISRQVVHYARGLNSSYVGGILEFMTPEFVKKWHPDIYSACKQEGNLSSLDYSLLKSNDRITSLACLPLSTVLRKIQIKHVNLFILDVEGAELDILHSIDWDSVVFDVICIETNGDRPYDFESTITKYLNKFGYHPSDHGGDLKGRNTWYVHQTFAPQKRPGLNKSCFNGVKKSLYSGKWMELDGNVGPFAPCTLEDGFEY
jgi:hypothetical protein